MHKRYSDLARESKQSFYAKEVAMVTLAGDYSWIGFIVIY